ncbi:MAG: uracil-DNA glycosylase [Gammaproteobacteria bacterium]|nr:uracil-DNA glycosylase [Gammaproteobacteria bacterium]
MDARAAWTARQQAILGELGIGVWRRRGCPATGEPAAGPGEAAQPGADATPHDWASLRAAVRDCRRCALHQGRTQAVFGVGNESASWMIIGEAPGAEEDRQGEPFVGPAGQLLNEMLRAVGAGRQDVYIANILKCRPPDNRDPRPDEVGACADHLAAQIRQLSPRLILAVGRIAAQALLGEESPLGRLRGRVHVHGPTGIPLVVTYHPAYLLRSPAEKRKAWDDLRLACSIAPPRTT